MKISFKNIHLIFYFIISLLFVTEVSGKDKKIKYSQHDISNYFSGIASIDLDSANNTFKYLNKVQSLKNTHSNYNIQFLRTLIILQKFEQAFDFSKSVWDENELFFEADLILGINYFLNKDYVKAEIHFERLNKISRYNFLFQDFIGNVLIAWSQASNNKKEDSFESINKIPNRYHHIKQIQKSFLHCFYDTDETENVFKKLVENENYDFSRYNFFLVDYLLSKQETKKAKKIINISRKEYSSNLLIKETNNFISGKKTKEITNFFNCQNSKDVIAEFFYILANLYSNEKDFQLSNFYLNISLFLNNKFQPNKILLAENYYFQKKYDLSKKMYNSIKKIGPVYSWFASQSISAIVEKTESKDKSVLYLKKEFSLLENVNFIHFYDLANHYKDNKNYEDSIKYYSLALEDVSKGSDLVHKILYNRGISYERNNQWKKAEKDLLESLSLLPEQPYVLNYLAYSWVDKKMNIEKALGMLEEAVRLKENDGYIIDSLGWAHYRNKNYVEAEKFLQKAVQLLPLDPIINDHYADVLWMLNRNIQARYFWKHAVSLNDIDIDVKEKINDKLIFGINEKS